LIRNYIEEMADSGRQRRENGNATIRPQTGPVNRALRRLRAKAKGLRVKGGAAKTGPEAQKTKKMKRPKPPLTQGPDASWQNTD
jgi:hypothetical protein